MNAVPFQLSVPMGLGHEGAAIETCTSRPGTTNGPGSGRGCHDEEAGTHRAGLHNISLPGHVPVAFGE